MVLLHNGYSYGNNKVKVPDSHVDSESSPAMVAGSWIRGGKVLAGGKIKRLKKHV